MPLKNPITESQIPASIARDTEVTAAVATKAPIANPIFAGLVTTAGQIFFPGTKNPSTNPNTLDDYEEGTWNPAITYVNPGTSNITFFRNTGRYQKIGNRVFVNFDIRINTFAKGTAQGFLIVSGLPFTPRAGQGFDNNIGVLQAGNTVFTGIPILQTSTGLSASNVLFLLKAISGQINVPLDDPTPGAIYFGQIDYEAS